MVVPTKTVSLSAMFGTTWPLLKWAVKKLDGASSDVHNKQHSKVHVHLESPCGAALTWTACTNRTSGELMKIRSSTTAFTHQEPTTGGTTLPKKDWVPLTCPIGPVKRWMFDSASELDSKGQLLMITKAVGLDEMDSLLITSPSGNRTQRSSPTHRLKPPQLARSPTLNLAKNTQLQFRQTCSTIQPTEFPLQSLTMRGTNSPSMTTRSVMLPRSTCMTQLWKELKDSFPEACTLRVSLTLE